MPTDRSEPCAPNDLSGRAGSFLAIWVASIVIAVALSLASVPAWISTAGWTLAFVWMGGACLLNARRCGRLHCYFSGPILLLGAALIALIGFDVIALGAIGAPAVVATTLALSGLTYLLELVWGRYRA